MKKGILLFFTFMIIFLFVACSGKNSPPPDLTGTWKEITTSESYQIANIHDDVIEIYWHTDNKGGGDTLYWIGSFDAPRDGREPYSWDSIKDVEQTDRKGGARVAQEDTKNFTYKKGQIQYSRIVGRFREEAKLEKQS